MMKTNTVSMLCGCAATIGVLALVAVFSSGLPVRMIASQSLFTFGALSHGNPLHSAQLHFDSNGGAVGITAKDQWHVVKGFHPSGAPGWSYDPITGILCALEGSQGIYDVSFSRTLYHAGGLAAVYRTAIKRDGAIVPGCSFDEGYPGGLDDVDHAGQPCIVTTEVGDEFTMQIANVSSAKDVTVTEGTVKAHRL